MTLRARGRLPRFRPALWALGPGAVIAAAGCYDTYCQSGPKYGTQCYTGADLHESQRSQGRMNEPGEAREWWNTPSPPPSPAPAPSTTAAARPAPSAAASSFAKPPGSAPPPK